MRPGHLAARLDHRARARRRDAAGGLAFMTLHFPEQVETNILTLDAWDPKSGTAEFKATAIRVEKPSPRRRPPRLDAERIRGWSA